FGIEKSLSLIDLFMKKTKFKINQLILSYCAFLTVSLYSLIDKKQKTPHKSPYKQEIYEASQLMK
ncbi:hypothetical protein, partial [Enterococcus gallinarum]|uniref:hypothetical protein n=1 Tax=Enterococcus gallinarum TaxID=1353 RepID=UPI0034A22B96